MVVRMKSQECSRLKVFKHKFSGIEMQLTSGTAGTEKFGTPFATLPNPASEPHAASENSSSFAASVCVFLKWLVALVAEKRSANVFIVTRIN